MLISNAEVAGRRVSLRSQDGLITEIADRIPAHSGEQEIDARGGVLLPGLHDHHLHLFSLAAQWASVACGPPAVESREALAAALRRAKPVSGWLRGTGYFESVAGELDRHQLDALGIESPLRIQHRSGSMWFLNSRAIEALDLDRIHSDSPPNNLTNSPTGIERDASGRATGRLFRADEWLRERLPSRSPPDLSAVGSFLARCGVTQVTDATPSNSAIEATLFRAAQRSGALPQRLRMMGDLSLSSIEEDEGFEIGEFKILLDEPALPELDELVSSIRTAHADERCIAVHTVTRTEIHFALAALGLAGTRHGDRLEHASVAPSEALDLVRRLGLSIVTQPNFVSERGDAYREHVAARDLTCLYRVRSWLEAGVPLAAGTDAPFGDPDPWRAMRAAIARRTESGACLGRDEIVSPETALRLFVDGFSHSAEAPSETASTGSESAAALAFRNLAVGQRADFCLLDTPWREARQALSRDRVALTIRAGRIIWPEND
jgi:predicted amidohydrolase YtcJ